MNARNSAAAIPAAVPELRDMVVVRSTPVVATLTLRDAGGDAESDDVLGRLVVKFTRFNTWYEINSWWEGRYLEQTARGSLKKTIKERGPKGSGQVRALFDHGFDFHIGDKILAVPDDIREDDDYAVLEGDLLDTSYNRDLLPGLRRGGYGSSFMFNVIRDEWNHEPPQSDHNPEGLPERTIREIRLYEAGPVTFPANPEATAEMNSGTRSGTDLLYERMARRDPASVSELRRRIMDLRTASDGPAGTATGPQPPAADDAQEPAPRHSAAAGRAQRARRIREAVLASR